MGRAVESERLSDIKYLNETIKIPCRLTADDGRVFFVRDWKVTCKLLDEPFIEAVVVRRAESEDRD